VQLAAQPVLLERANKLTVPSYKAQKIKES
jgi:hypothetical protein